ncbi:MAG: hypothetical protein ACRBFS_13630 [Aureispira sp.]
MQLGGWMIKLLVWIIWGQQLVAQTPFCSQIHTSAPSTSLVGTSFAPPTTLRILKNFLCQDFLALPSPARFSYVNPMSSENNKNLYSQNIALVLFATAYQRRGESLLMNSPIKEVLCQPTYVPTSSTRWYIGDRLFAVDNSAFFGIEFDSSFAYRGGVVRIGDSSEKAVVILVSLYPK